MASPDVHPAVKEVLFSAEAIHARLLGLAKQINEHYAGCDGKLVLVAVLKGSFMFMADLCRLITVEHQVEFMALSSYGSGTESSGNVRIVMDLRRDVAGKHVLIVEDIIDTGHTLQKLLNLLENRNAASVETVALLRKPDQLKVPRLPVKWVGFDIPPAFVVGYGLDYAERFRTLPYVGVLREETYSR